MFHDSLDDLLRVVLVGPAAYAWLVLVLETNGTFSVIPTDALGSGSALDDLRDDVRRT